VEEVGVGFEDAGDEEGVVCVDCAAEADGGVDPVQRAWVSDCRRIWGKGSYILVDGRAWPAAGSGRPGREG
jgi:hypothetical protein